MFRTTKECIALLSGPVNGPFKLTIKAGANVIKVTDCPKPFFAVGDAKSITMVNGEPLTDEIYRYIDHDYRHRYAVIPDDMVEEIDLTILSRYGWVRREDSLVEIWYKGYDTAVGVKTAMVARYNNCIDYHDRLIATYESEGRNIVGRVFTASNTFEESIAEIDRLIDQSYARKLFLERGVLC